MDWKLISLGTAGLMTIVASLIDAASDRRSYETAAIKAVKQRGEEANQELAAAKEVVKAVNDLTNKERKDFVTKIGAWKKESGYTDQIRDIHDGKMAELEEFKQSIDYSNRRKNIEDEFEDALEAYKESTDYEYGISVMEAKIDDAKERYKKRCKRIELAGGSDDDISDALNDIKKSEKEKMDEVIKECRSEISSMKNKISSEETKLNRKKQQSLRELESELQATKTRLNKEEEAECKVLQAKKSEEEKRIREEISAGRSELETQNLNRYDDAMAFINHQESLDAGRANDIYQTTPRYQKWADYLTDNDVPKWIVGLLGALPLIPAGYLIGGYVKFVYKVVRAM